MCVCVTILPTLSIVTLPTKHTMSVTLTLTLSALVEDRPCLVSKCAHATLHSSTPTTTIPTQPSSCSCGMIAHEFFHHTHTSLSLSHTLTCAHRYVMIETELVALSLSRSLWCFSASSIRSKKQYYAAAGGAGDALGTGC